MSSPLAICTVTHNAAADLPDYLEFVGRLTYRPIELVIVDCASTDGSADVARAHLPESMPSQVIALEENLGFAAGMNRAIAATSAVFVLSLNADTRPRPDFAAALVRRLESGSRTPVGAVTGRLTRPEEDGESLVDAAGMRLRPTWRHLDRGSGEPERGQFAAPEAVFGGTGAATLYYRPALEDAAIDGEIFLAEFHSFREDAELCFRLRERGWEIVYEPAAIATHGRRNVPERRRQMPAHVNYHSLKNRYLLRAYHGTAASLVATAIPATLRDVVILGYVLARERSSLPALAWLWRQRKHILARRRLIQSRRTLSSRRLAAWFFRSGRPL